MKRNDSPAPLLFLALVLVLPLAWTLTSCGDSDPAAEQALFKVAGIEGTKDCALFRQKENRWLKVTGQEANLFLFEGDKVKTGEGTTVLLRLPNGGSSFLQEKTEFEVTRLERSKEGASLGHVIMKIIRGTGLFSVKKAPPAFSVSTNHAVTGVLGTQFAVTADDEGTKVDVVEGRVAVTPRPDEATPIPSPLKLMKDPGSSTVLEKGRSVAVKPTGEVTRSAPVDVARLSRLVDLFSRLRGIQTKPGWNR